MARPRKIHIDNDQPQWVCYKCGVKYGSFRAGTCTWHPDTCGVCGATASCTAPRDFGYLLKGWKERRDIDEEEDMVDG